MAQTALAIERYRLEHDRLPSTLEALVPMYLEEVLPDPYDGQPLRYRTLEGGYLLYSIYRNRVDDGGADPTPRNRRKRIEDLLFKVMR